MKKILAFTRSVFLLLIGLCLVSETPAQNWQGGVIIGLNTSQIDGDLAAGFKQAGLHVGGFVTYSFTDRIAIQPEVLYEQLGSANDDGLLARINTFSFPLLLRIDLPVTLGDQVQEVQFFAGPAAGVLLRARDFADIEVQGLDKVDLRTLAGIGYQMGNIGLGIRYGYSLSSFLKQNNPSGLLQPGANGLFHNYISFSLRVNV